MTSSKEHDKNRISVRYKIPSIPAPFLTPANEVDVDILGAQDLPVYVNYDGIQEGDTLRPVWRGADPQGEPFDALGSVVRVVDPDPDLGVLVTITNSEVVDARGGHAFLSYIVNGNDEQESFRRFCFVGVRPQGEALPVVQVIESHDQAIVLADLGGNGARVVVAPYTAMQAGDEVTLVFQGYDDFGYKLPVKQYPLQVTDQATGKPLQWLVPKSQFSSIENGRAELHYRLKLKGQTDEVLAPVQTFSVPATAPSLPDPLPVVKIDDYAGGPLDPGMFPAGMTLRLATPGLASSGDHVLLHWLGADLDNRYSQSLRLDTSCVPGSELVFKLDHQAVVNSAGDDITVFYQIAREGWALSADRLRFAVDMPRTLPLLSVRNAAGEGTGKGVVEALYLTREGAYVTVPASADVRPGESLRVHWEGHANGGRHVAEQPVAGETHRFQIPPSAIAANMEQVAGEDEKRFAIRYEVVTAQGGIFSAPYNLRILPIAVSDYQPPNCLEATAGSLSVASLGARDATLEVASWAFMALGQLVTLSVAGVDGNGNATTEHLLTAAPVTQAQLDAGKVVQPIPNTFIKSLKVGTSMSMNLNLSFDGGDTTFPRSAPISSRLTIRA
ncbi:hypothetical protein PS627_01240 [Pseudomonas fluorescens]|uniref:hypothetical protein n=1 Tax=Pseudomonas fluorescens TaxID=294 RepID=UPI0012539176|nr:hypothetical protein [Pseudomonas fluorescens]CAG8865336.1 hypothetical protein PS627_01240 [Pseudomonas fluorescens]VVP66706.1 hypothetical protein PS910_00052 [Pseudomonas fluorescens]